MSAITSLLSKFTTSDKEEPTPKPAMSENPPRFIIIGAGSRGRGYAEAVVRGSNGIITAVAEPVKFTREILGREFIWGDGEPKEGQSFSDWREFIEYETARRARVAAGEKDVPLGVDGAFVCVLDQQHRDVVVGLGPLGLNIMCEKPLATSLQDCIDIYKALKPSQSSKVFAIGHVLRYSPHNVLLRKLLVEDKVIGDINSVNHTEPVGWWHYTHSYVRGNWRNSKTTGPSLLTKCCHDIDLLLWLLCSPEKAGEGEAHLPATVSSSGGLQYFKKSRKPAAAGAATNCTKCALGDSGCKYSAKNVYLGDGCKAVGTGNTRWPLTVVVHDLEDYPTQEARKGALAKVLEDDYDASTPESEIQSRNWFGRCVWESDNNVCDDQIVSITWPESNKPAKQAVFHMVAQTIKQCDRYSNFYGDKGEIYADSFKIVIKDFATGEVKTLHPKIEHAGHGGGDLGLTRQFVLACDRIKSHGWEAEKAQNEFLGCTLEEVLRSHAMVFAAEEARVDQKVLKWEDWWDSAVVNELKK